MEMPDQERSTSLTGLLEAVRTVLKGEQANDALTLERRFARVEAMIDGLQRSNAEGFEGVHTRLDRLNGSVTEHQQWIGGHKVEHALDAGQRLGGIAYTTRLLTVVTIAVAFGGLLVNVLSKLIGR